MYKHHLDSIEELKKYFINKKEVIAVILGGSVAKGMERVDSDIDAMVIVSNEDYNIRCKENHTAETIKGYCTYDAGYFDIKYMTKEYLKEAVIKGSEPTRNSFLKAKVLFSKDKEIEDIVPNIGVFQESEMEDKMLSFYGDLILNYEYIMKTCKAEGFALFHAVNEIVYSVYRLILQENKILFPCNRRLEETLEKIENKPDNIIQLAENLMNLRTIESADCFVEAYMEWKSYQEPENRNEVLSRYVLDFEQWWRVERPLIAEW